MFCFHDPLPPFLYGKQFVGARMEPFVTIVAHQIGFSPEETIFAIGCKHRWMDNNGHLWLKHHFILTRNTGLNPVDSAEMARGRLEKVAATQCVSLPGQNNIKSRRSPEGFCVDIHSPPIR